jgi:membrane-associated phospholipid phosphatase
VAATAHARWSVLAFVGLAVVVARAGNGRLGQFDQAVIRKLQAGRSPAAVQAARALSALAEPGFAVFPMTVASIIAARRGGWPRACVPGLTVASGTAVRRLLSKAIARPRPPAALWLAEPEGFSMPSKHTSLAALTAGACVGSALAGGPGRHEAALLAAASVGASRIYLGVHWPTDVLAAWIFAEAWLHLAEAVLPEPAARGKADRAETTGIHRRGPHGHA